jgi:hypothetical protein
LIGRPRGLPTVMDRLEGVKREKSQKLSISVAYVAIVSTAPAPIVRIVSPVESGLMLWVREIPPACTNSHTASNSMTTYLMGPAQSW